MDSLKGTTSADQQIPFARLQCCASCGKLARDMWHLADGMGKHTVLVANPKGTLIVAVVTATTNITSNGDTS